MEVLTVLVFSLLGTSAMHEPTLNGGLTVSYRVVLELNGRQRQLKLKDECMCVCVK